MKIERAGQAARPQFLVPEFCLFKCSRGPSRRDGQRPDVPAGLKSARQLIAAVPIAREG